MPVSREVLVNAIRTALEPLDYVHAMWEGGSTAFGRADELSDLDLQLDVDDEHVGGAFSAVESALQSVSPIELSYTVPEPAWHGMSQRFYKLRDTTEFLLIDLAVRKASDRHRFNEIELHGVPLIYFDKAGVVVATHLDPAQQAARLQARLAELQVLFPLFKSFVRKEVLRGNALGALHYYYGLVWRPLHEAALMLHCPARYNYSPHYSVFELPPELLAQLTVLYYVGGMDELARKVESASMLFAAITAELEQRHTAA